MSAPLILAVLLEEDLPDVHVVDVLEQVLPQDVDRLAVVLLLLLHDLLKLLAHLASLVQVGLELGVLGLELLLLLGQLVAGVLELLEIG